LPLRRQRIATGVAARTQSPAKVETRRRRFAALKSRADDRRQRRLGERSVTTSVLVLRAQTTVLTFAPGFGALKVRSAAIGRPQGT